MRPPTRGCDNSRPRPPARPGENTTIGVIATSAPLTAAQTERLAIVTNDGMARAIRPAHSTGDGDTVFSVTTAEDPATVHQDTFVESGRECSRILSAAADTYSRAITHAALSANPDTGETYCERFPTACPGDKGNGPGKHDDALAAPGATGGGPASGRPASAGAVLLGLHPAVGALVGLLTVAIVVAH